MQIKDLARSATAAGATMVVTKTSSGYGLKADYGAKIDPIQCFTQRNEPRHWKSLDVLFKHLSQAQYVGKIEMVMTHQADLL